MIELHNIWKIYRLGELELPVLKGVSLSLAQGEFVALMGASGSGKSTLMNVLGCLDQPSSGSYFFEGQDVATLSRDGRARLRNRKMGFVFQSFQLLPRTSALENVMMPLLYATPPISSAEGTARAKELLAKVGLADRMYHTPAQLSGGQQQRVAIARALINRPPLLFADEPTGNLDSTSSQEILAMFAALNREEGFTTVLVTHDATISAQAKRIIRLRDGRIEGSDVTAPAGVPA